MVLTGLLTFTWPERAGMQPWVDAACPPLSTCLQSEGFYSKAQYAHTWSVVKVMYWGKRRRLSGYNREEV